MLNERNAQTINRLCEATRKVGPQITRAQLRRKKCAVEVCLGNVNEGVGYPPGDVRPVPAKGRLNQRVQTVVAPLRCRAHHLGDFLVVLSAETEWQGAYGNERDKTWIKPLFGELTIEDLAEPETAVEVFELAKTFWKPLLDADGKVKKSSGKKEQPGAESSSDSEEDEP
jgi:hypothetical protein